MSMYKYMEKQCESLTIRSNSHFFGRLTIVTTYMAEVFRKQKHDLPKTVRNVKAPRKSAQFDAENAASEIRFS